jgi:hypothetical protein
MGTRTEKNFVQTNALDVVMTVPKRPERNIVDDRFGDKFPIDASGLTPKYTLKKVFVFLMMNLFSNSVDLEFWRSACLYKNTKNRYGKSETRISDLCLRLFPSWSYA